MKNKFGQEVTWSLWKIQPDKNYYSTLYVWVNPEGLVKFCRSIEYYGFLPHSYNITIEENELISNLKKRFGKNLKKVNHKMTDEHLSKGWLLL